MAEHQQMTIKIDKKGKMKIETEGFTGAACSTEIGKFVAGKVSNDVKKPEYFETETENTIKQGL